jgi:hypothetical protein
MSIYRRIRALEHKADHSDARKSRARPAPRARARTSRRETREALNDLEGLQLWGALREELLNFRRKINLKTAHDSYEHWRDSDSRRPRARRGYGLLGRDLTAR